MTFIKTKKKVLVVAISMLIAVAVFAGMPAEKGVPNVNGWYEGEEIYYLDLGIEEGVTERGDYDIYAIGGPRVYQANVVEFIPGEPGYSPHWNVHVVHTAEGVTVQDIIDAGYSSDHFDDEGVVFDDVEDILAAEGDGLVTIATPGVVVLCPVVSVKAGKLQPEDFETLEPGDTF